ncbi:hypothetical protein [Streptacidiphilus monticola]|uniref:DUF8083 domain-containing protein n=1 Tax=Streptacidiphilus monticola TaxID=2161674 RepID=A0ABW1G4C1_9ACTN
MTALRTSVLPPYAAYLRVYEPLAAFAEPDRSYWQGYAASRTEPLTELDERRQRLAELTAVPPLAIPERESRDAFVHEADGVLHICPWGTRLRSWLALEQLTQELPPSLLDALVPARVRTDAEADWDRWRTQNPDGRPWILTSTWNVPVRWFLLFGPEEREYVPARLTADPENAEGVKQRTAPLLRYRTPMAQARRRVARGFRVLRQTVQEGPLVGGVEEVGRWLEEFHPRSLVELDYGGLVHALPESELAADHSAGDVELGLAALREGDSRRAARCYRTLTERWRRVQDLEFAN